MSSETKLPHGTLYLVATPIGNLEDITYRAVRILGEVDLIAAEDTRHTRGLLAHFGLHTPLFSYHEHNKATAGKELINLLLNGKNIACVSDAGLPGIADPGTDLARAAIDNDVAITVIPGANAALTALIASGLDTRRFEFVGFLPRTAQKRHELLAELATHAATLIFYEAPHRLKATLGEIAAALGASRPAAICRELTKKFEEYRRATLGELLDKIDESEQRGEFVICVAGCDLSAKNTADSIPVTDGKDATDKYDAVVAAVRAAIGRGEAEKEALRTAAKACNLSRRDVYKIWLAGKQ